MPAPEYNPLDPVRLVAAKHLLGVGHSWEVPPVADQALSEGVYSDSLMELAAMVAPTWAVVAPLLERAVVELGLPFPSKTEAAWYLAEHIIRRIALDGAQPFESLSLLREVSYAAADVLPNKTYVGDGLDVACLIGLYWSYSEPTENYYELENRLISNEVERRSLLDAHARDECRRWLARHTSHASLKDNSPPR